MTCCPTLRGICPACPIQVRGLFAYVHNFLATRERAGRWIYQFNELASFVRAFEGTPADPQAKELLDASVALVVGLEHGDRMKDHLGRLQTAFREFGPIMEAHFSHVAGNSTLE